MKCSQLLEHLEYTCLQGSTDVKVTAVVNDSRKIEEGCLFLCIKGAAFDGHKFAAEAAEKGAAVLVVEDEGRQHPLCDGIDFCRMVWLSSRGAYHNRCYRNKGQDNNNLYGEVSLRGGRT